MKYSIIVYLLLISYFSEAQVNLIPNPSFEDTTNCPNFWNNNGFPWYSANLATPDYYYGLSPSCGITAFNNPSGYQMPRSGNAYAGIFLSQSTTREYLQSKLDSPLIAGSVYKLEIYVSRANYFDLATDALGVYLSLNSTFDSTSGVINYTPQIMNVAGNILSDSLNWMKVSGHYIATGGEQYITIGNFNDASSTTLIDVDNSPLSTFHHAYIYIDDVSLVLDTLQSINRVIHTSTYIWPNPCKDYLCVNFKQGANDIVNIRNYFGQIVYESQNDSKVISCHDISQLPSGIYFLEISSITSKVMMSFIKL